MEVKAIARYVHISPRKVRPSRSRTVISALPR